MRRATGRGGSRSFSKGIATVADEAVATARRLHVIVGENRERLLASNDATVLSLRLFELLPRHPILTVNRVIELLDCSMKFLVGQLGLGLKKPG